jgi:hypothetical protein
LESERSFFNDLQFKANHNSHQRHNLIGFDKPVGYPCFVTNETQSLVQGNVTQFPRSESGVLSPESPLAASAQGTGGEGLLVRHLSACSHAGKNTAGFNHIL